jgi:hypothetical protein
MISSGLDDQSEEPTKLLSDKPLLSASGEPQTDSSGSQRHAVSLEWTTAASEVPLDLHIAQFETDSESELRPSLPASPPPAMPTTPPPTAPPDGASFALGDIVTVLPLSSASDLPVTDILPSLIVISDCSSTSLKPEESSIELEFAKRVSSGNSSETKHHETGITRSPDRIFRTREQELPIDNNSELADKAHNSVQAVIGEDSKVTLDIKSTAAALQSESSAAMFQNESSAAALQSEISAAALPSESSAAALQSESSAAALQIDNESTRTENHDSSSQASFRDMPVRGHVLRLSQSFNSKASSPSKHVSRTTISFGTSDSSHGVQPSTTTTWTRPAGGLPPATDSSPASPPPSTTTWTRPAGSFSPVTTLTEKGEVNNQRASPFRKFQLNIPTRTTHHAFSTPGDQSFKSAMHKFASLSSTTSPSSITVSPISSAKDGVTQIRVHSNEGSDGGGHHVLRMRKDLKNTISLPSRLSLESRDSASNVTI